MGAVIDDTQATPHTLSATMGVAECGNMRLMDGAKDQLYAEAKTWDQWQRAGARRGAANIKKQAQHRAQPAAMGLPASDGHGC